MDRMLKSRESDNSGKKCKSSGGKKKKAKKSKGKSKKPKLYEIDNVDELCSIIEGEKKKKTGKQADYYNSSRKATATDTISNISTEEEDEAITMEILQLKE